MLAKIVLYGWQKFFETEPYTTRVPYSLHLQHTDKQLDIVQGWSFTVNKDFVKYFSLLHVVQMW